MVESGKDLKIDAAWLADRINSTVVDADGHWRTALLNDILAKAAKPCVPEESTKKTVFTVGAEETTSEEGALVASTNRGCRALFESGGAIARVYKDGMTRAPVVQFESTLKALEMKGVLESPDCFRELKDVFDATSSYAKLQRLEADVCGRLLFIRFEATTGDAMGMNMVSKGVNCVLSHLKKKYPEMEILSLSGNYCVDKKASAINWIKGRGKSVVSEATIPAAVIQSVLKTTVDAMVRLGQAKLMIGSSMAGTVGGWNAHAANVVAAIFIATGQVNANHCCSIRILSK
ncbi:unnamed protein product [Gongylonema pulchrum]|uniref:3-hydroxy-3-methylglutaryl-coenzyme A reductase n=1 Tax=Gongylonema pulchrum TaxID=637853 RepID=A0A183DXD4_9BILA|nr:unnamed protein product [Gongylonema pulchrum]